jgi:hypothetical protein
MRRIFPGRADSVTAVNAPWLAQLEDTLAEVELAIAVVTVAAVAGRGLDLDEEDLRGAARRALFVLAAGGDPDRGLDLNGPAVSSFAAELDEPARRAALRAGLVDLAGQAAGLAHVSEAAHALLDAPETAWRAFACAVLADQLAADE